MIKKLLLAVMLLIYSQSAFAIDRNELNLEFFERFNDEHLVYYVNQALENNHDAKQATHRVEQYRQGVKYSFSRELPSLSVSANYLGVKVPKLDNFEIEKNAFVLPFTVNYEADFLLKNRDKTKSAKKSYEAVKLEEKAIYISLLSDVATVYTNILQYNELIRIADENLAIRTNILDADKRKMERGVIDSNALNDSEQRLEDAKNNLEALCKQREILLMQLAVLTGVSSTEIDRLHIGDFKSYEYKDSIPSVIESDVIFSRPDVMAVETQLQKAKIDTRIARKEFLPTFNITGLWVFNTIAPGAFFSWESSLVAILAGATQDIFTGGRKIANLKIQKSKYEELFEKYRQTDLEAVKEVNTALCIVKHDTRIDENTKNKLNLELKNIENSKKELERGIISNPQYLFELSELIRVQDSAVRAKNQRLVNYFTLYKAVGGKL